MNSARYKLNDKSDDDIDRLRNNNSYKLRGSCKVSAQQLNDVTCANGFMSTLALCVGSSKSVDIVDVATMQVCTKICTHRSPNHLNFHSGQIVMLLADHFVLVCW